MHKAEELPSVLLLGCSGSGKSTIVSQWKMMCSDRGSKPKPKAKGDGAKADHALQFSVTPNTGYERDTLTFQNRAFVVMEVGGGMKGTWASYFNRCHALIYVLDKANRRQIAAVAFDLATLLTSPKLAKVPVLFVLNKCDLPTAMTRTELQTLLRFDDILCSAPQLSYLYPRVPPPRAAPQSSGTGAGAGGAPHAPTASPSLHGHVHPMMAHAHGHKDAGAAAASHGRTSSWSQPATANAAHHGHGHGHGQGAAAGAAAGAGAGAASGVGAVHALLPPVPAGATLSSPLPYQPFSVSIAPASTSSVLVAATAAAQIAGNVPGSAAAAASTVGPGHSPPLPAAGVHAVTVDRTGSKYTSDLKGGLSSVSGAGTAGVLPGAKAVSVAGPEPKSPKGKSAAYDFGTAPGTGTGTVTGTGTASGSGARVGGVSGPPKPALKFPVGGGGPASPVMGASASPIVSVGGVQPSLMSLHPASGAAAAAAAAGGGSPPRPGAAAGAGAGAGAASDGALAGAGGGGHTHSSSMQLTARDAAAAHAKGPVLPPTLPVFETSGSTRAGVSALLEYVSFLLYALPPPPVATGPASVLSGRGSAPSDLASVGGANKARVHA